MAEIDLTNISASSISTPASGVTATFVDVIDKKIRRKDDTGFVDSYLQNFSTTAQSPVASTRTYITGTNFKVAGQKLQVGSQFRWFFTLTKTAAGAATSTIDIAVGTAGTTADTARVSFIKPIGSVIADEGTIAVNAVVRSIGASGVIVGEFTMLHNGNTSGHMTVPMAVLNTISAGFDMTVVALQVGLCITTGAGDVVTIQMVQSEAWDI